MRPISPKSRSKTANTVYQFLPKIGIDDHYVHYYSEEITNMPPKKAIGMLIL
jgi:hypothetical protein